MKEKYSKRDFINLAILSAAYIIIILILIIPGKVYGSQLDWENQHWVLPEYFRNRFYETEQFFPSFASEIGGGQNIYYFAYYGLYSPFLLLSYLLPFIEMRTYIIAVNIIAVFAGIWLFYRWIRMKYDAKVTFFVTLLFLMAAPVILHSHRHIMFVDYIPFLLMLFISIKSYMEGKGRLWHITISSFLLVTTSFYFSVGSFIAAGIYSIMIYMDRNENKSLKKAIKAILPVIGSVTVAVCMAGILIIPTASALMGGRQEASSGFDFSMLIPSLNGQFILYGPYSMGLTAISVYGAVWTFFDRRRENRANRFFAVILGIMAICPMVVYAFNGGLYLDGKVLIPFLPLALYMTAQFVKQIYTLYDNNENKYEVTSFKKTIITGTVLNLVLFIIGLEKYERLAHIAEVLPLVLCFYIFMKKRNPKAVLVPFAVIVTIVCIVLNCTDTLVDYDENRIADRNAAKELADNVIDEEESVYRFTSNWGRWANVNMVLTSGYCQVSAYSSSVNTHFKNFYLNEMYNDVTYRNNAILSTSYNSLYNIYMGVKYYVSRQGFVPVGYEKICEKNNISIYSNDLAYPIGYATDNVISEELYGSLSYPYNVESLLKYKVADNAAVYGAERKNISLEVKKEEIAYEPVNVSDTAGGVERTDTGYMITVKTGQTKKLKLKLKEPVEGKVIFVRFMVDNDIEGKETSDVSVTLNGIKNKLTAADWKYHNENYMFEYVLDGTEYMDEIDVTLSGGNYEITDIECYTLDYSQIKEFRNSLDEFYIDKEKTKGDVIEGNIEVKNDGWFHISLPYDKGFSIYVDGKETDYYTSDKDFTGFPIKKGYHNIRVEYTAPGYKAGLILSAVGALMFLLELISKKRLAEGNRV